MSSSEDRNSSTSSTSSDEQHSKAKSSWKKVPWRVARKGAQKVIVHSKKRGPSSSNVENSMPILNYQDDPPKFAEPEVASEVV